MSLLPELASRPMPPAVIAPRLERLLHALSQHERVLRADELAAYVAHAQLTLADLAPFASLHPSHYAHREIYRSRELEVGCIGWRSGQHSPIHDHGASACCVRVLAGVLTNTEYTERDPGGLRPCRESKLGAGALISYRGSEIHRMANLEPSGALLFTLHLYSPPLAPMNHRERIPCHFPRHPKLPGAQP